MSSSPITSRTRRRSRHSLRLVPDDAEPRVVPRSTREAAARVATGPIARRARREAEDSAHGEAVRAYVARCKAAGLPAERVLLRVTEAARRHRLAHRDAGDAPATRGAAFRAFLAAYYGDGPASRAPPGR
jgi:hypothetical protein